MAHLQSHQIDQGHQPEVLTDEYGKPISKTTHPTGTTGTTTTTRGLHRSGSGSSSSEEDEHGVRRKKGMKEKIKEKIPGVGGQHDQSSHATPPTTPAGYEVAGEHHQEKKGIMDKIKEKIPGTGTPHQGQQN